MGLQVIPDVHTLPFVLFGFFHAQEDIADRHHHGQVAVHVFGELWLRNIFGRMHRIDHLAGHLQLMVDALEHDPFVDRLVFPADEIPIHVHIQVVHGLHVRQWLVNEDVIDVEAMLGKGEADFTQKRCAVDDRMHEQVLALPEMPDLAPGEFPFHREDIAIMHDRAGVLMHLFIYVIGDHHVGRNGKLHLQAQIAHHGNHRQFIQPVIGVDHLEIQAAGFLQGSIHAAAVATVFLIYHLHDAGVTGFPLMGLLAGIVFR